MHLLAAKPGGFSDDEGIVDLQQTPAEIIVLSAADGTLSALAASVESLPDSFPSVRLANWMNLTKPAAFDLYEASVLEHAELIVLSLLGGKNYWQYGLERLVDWAAAAKPSQNRRLIIVPGDDALDQALLDASTVGSAEAFRVWRYLREGGVDNHRQLLQYLGAQYFSQTTDWQEPRTLPTCMLYMPSKAHASLADWQQRWQQNPDAPTALLLFYRSHLQSGNTAMFDALITCLEAANLNVLPIAINSLKNAESLALVNDLLLTSQASIILNTTGFSSNTVSSPELSSQPSRAVSPFVVDVPVLQLMLASSNEAYWQSYSQGLSSRDIAMQVVLPEMDGRITTRAISFKSEAYYSKRCQLSVVRYVLHQERAEFVAELAVRYCALTKKDNAQKRVALILANYPTKDGRIGNGVGLDTPASTLNILNAMKAAGYPLQDIPDDGNALIEALLESVTNNPNTLHQLPCWQSLCVDEYNGFFAALPLKTQQAVLERWGTPDKDPKYREHRLMIAGIRLGETFVGIQPARGFNLDLLANYHDPDLVPPHSYLAFYFWLRHCYQIDAVIHVGKHGNLEWLPGKGNALSATCWPDVILGPTPHFYPFIVNDPGEGAQAKRRTQAVIIDHLMPPMTRAEVYGDLAELENLVDEYYQALGMDARREQWLRDKILQQIRQTHVLEELNITQQNDDELLEQLDAYLCDIKEAQIRHGLHILGQLPANDKLADTLVALVRLPRGVDNMGKGLLHNLVDDLNLAPFDPLKNEQAVWSGNKPDVLQTISNSAWRTEADTRERLELYALELINKYVLGDQEIDAMVQASLPNTSQQLTFIKNTVLAALHRSVEQETSALLKGLSGRFIEPGPSGAPTRGRLDTLPTGRNFFSVDNRSIPSKAAWAIGKLSADALIERHLQDHGDYPVQLGLSVWGTATMRTGGDDIAQAFALMGVKPIWAVGSQRVIDIEIIPSMLLQRPRVDVTLRVSGFFRDAFPNVMRLFDTAVLAIATLDEPGNSNTIKQHVTARAQELSEQGMSEEEAFREASFRVFGSKPGAYGAGLQGLIDERCWESTKDLAEAYVNWGGYAYGSGELKDGVQAKRAFQQQLSQVDTVAHNQDNREHDILDSDDYYQFQGGMSNAVSVFKGVAPVVYHNDHSNPAAPKIRTLKEELNRVIRSRVLNPKWQNAMREHGYKGAFEMAASVDYLFAYDATTQLIDNYQYEQVADSLIFDEKNQAFLRDNNVNALEEMAERLLEATQRNMWSDSEEYAEKLQGLLLDLDNQKEGAQ
ncbi:MAG: cobaltochelatase subunit CobN [Cycloclasticus sp. symbiont of Bathymodiolus heckerae]|nr:MAG: cobaltochelatase subunit CobN [Cycloclasticus sp. symbiont of Bathymodiolus heckerae]